MPQEEHTCHPPLEYIRSHHLPEKFVVDNTRPKRPSENASNASKHHMRWANLNTIVRFYILEDRYLISTMMGCEYKFSFPHCGYYLTAEQYASFVV